LKLDAYFEATYIMLSRLGLKKIEPPIDGSAIDRRVSSHSEICPKCAFNSEYFKRITLLHINIYNNILIETAFYDML